LNARLTVLGTVGGFIVAVPGGAIWKLGGSSALLWVDAFVFVAAAVAGFRLPTFTRSRSLPMSDSPDDLEPELDERAADLARLQPVGHPEVLLGLSAMSIIRGLQGFQIFLLAFGLRRLGTLAAQVLLAFMVGLAGALAQPSFDAMTQRYIPQRAQGRAFARFATRQQLIWVLGSLIPVVVSFSLPQGDAVMAVLAGLGGLTYVTGRRAVRSPRAAAA
jgi:hypothetical protein